MSRSHSNAAILEPLEGDPQTTSNGLRLADDDVIPYSTNPTTVIRQMRAEGLTWLECGVYQHIADRQWNKDGECWQGNTAIGKDLSITAGTVSRAINKLKRAGYLSVRWSETGRRMRVQTRGFARTDQGACAYAQPYKENNTKKTTQQEVCVFSDKHRALMGEDSLDRLLDKYGESSVRQGLAVCDSYDPGELENPVGFLTRAIRENWKPKKATKQQTTFSECAFDHARIIESFIQADPGHRAIVDELLDKGTSEGLVAYKIWSKKI